jgi:hypothetical protein
MVDRTTGASIRRQRCAVRQLPLLLCAVAGQTMIALGCFMDGGPAAPCEVVDLAAATLAERDSRLLQSSRVAAASLTDRR